MAKKKDKIHVIYKRVGFDPVEVEIDNNLETLQRMIGGYIEAVPWYFYKGMIMLVDEEGKLDRRPLNFVYKGEQIVGSVMWLGTKGDEFTDCPYGLEEFRRRWPWLFEEVET